jgi:hypothetical protein
MQIFEIMKRFFFLLLSGIGFSVASVAQWNADPSINTAIVTAPGEDVIPKIATTESGISYISWFSLEVGNYNVRLQKLDVYGNKLWAAEGLLVSDHPSMTWLTDWDMTVDLDEHAILAFQDIRTGNNDVFAYRISPNGDFVWGADGLQLSEGAAFDVSPKIAITNAENVIIAWQADEVIIRQKIAPDGTLLWGASGITMSGVNTFSWPQLLPVGDDDVIMKYFEDSGPVWAPTRHVFAQRFDPDGNAVWAQQAVISDAGGISAWTQIFPFINDGSDGFFIAWHDDRDNNTLANMWVQHIGNDGSVLFPADGSEVSTQGARNHFYAHLALPVGSAEIYVYWNEMDPNQNLRGIYGQKFSAAGDRWWTDNGKTFIEISSLNVYPLAARDGGADMVVFYEEYFNALDGKIKAMRIDSAGNYVWDPNMIDMCSVQSSKVHAEVGILNNGQWIAVWEDDRNGNPDVYGQNIQEDGSLGPVTISYYLDIYPDSLFFDDFQSTIDGQYFTIKNNTDVPLTIMNMSLYNTLPGWMWLISGFGGSFPYTVEPGDSLYLLVNISFPTGSAELFDYVYDDILIEMEVQAYTVTICLNSDLLESADGGFVRDQVTCYPNPFSEMVRINFKCNKQSDAIVIILDSQGEAILTSRIGCQPGRNQMTWDGKNGTGSCVPSGLYFYKIETADKTFSGSMIKTNR